MNRIVKWFAIGCAQLLFATLAHAQGVIVQDDFTGSASSLPWTVFGGACLTAGNNAPGSIPACVGNPYYQNNTLVGGATATLPDVAGNGALRLTNGTSSYDQNGAILSPNPFPAEAGLQVTFTSVTYGGDSGGGTGADGMSFILADGARTIKDIGGTGGTLGYTCTHGGTNDADGITAGYLGLGIDEYGNFLASTNSVNGLTPGPQSNRIGLRGAGTVSWAWLNANYPAYYPATLSSQSRLQAVESTCASGTLWDYSASSARNTGIHVAAYPAIPGGYVVLPSTKPLADEAATTRLAATPISYKLILTQNGLLSFSYSYNGGTFRPILNQAPIASLSPDNATVPKSFIFGFAASVGGYNNVHEITCFKATPADTTTTSAGTNTQQSGQVQAGSQVYLAFAHSDNAWGQLTAENLVYNASTQQLSIATIANWDANCVLTGGNCAATSGTNNAEASSARTIITWNPTAQLGTPLEWASLAKSQQTALNAADGLGKTRLAYLRGDRQGEISQSGPFRDRTGVLGDIVDSSPTWSGPPAAPYGDVWSDQLLGSKAVTPPENSGPNTYSSFAKGAAKRLNVVFVGANDGILHGFEAGAYDGTGSGAGNFGNFVPTRNDGKEVIAYAPNAVLKTIHDPMTPALDFSSPLYAHNFFVDATPYAGDLYYANAWHTWLVGGLGPGGNAIFALDATDPTQFSETNASSLVKGEWSSTTLACVNVTMQCGNNLGQTYGTPAIRRLHNGLWALLFGNGVNSASGHAGMFVMIIGSTGTVTGTYFLDTGSGSPGASNGIVGITPVDLDGDHIADYVYAGDLQGNVWRFDLTSATPANWANTAPILLFTTPKGQPISTPVQVVSSTNSSGVPRVIVEFGTGLKTPETLTTPTSYAKGTQALYGIWDANFSAWDATSAQQYAKLATSGAVTFSQLQQQTVLTTVGANRTLSTNSVCWQGSQSGCSQRGFYLNLPGANEQVIAPPLLVNGAFLVNTIVPASNSPLNCLAETPTGWTMALDASSGAALPTPFFSDGNNNPLTLGNGVVVSGVQFNASGTGTIVVSPAGATTVVTQTLSGSGTAYRVFPPGGGSGSRITWIQLR